MSDFDDMTKYIIVYRFQALKLNTIEYLMFINCYGKANIVTYDWTLFVSEPIRNIFYLHEAMFEIPM